MGKIKRTFVPAGEPAVDRALALVREYTGKLRGAIRRARDVREEYITAKRKRDDEQTSANPKHGSKDAAQEQHLWFQTVEIFRTRHEEYVGYLRTLFPQTTKLAQHVSQLITHATDKTLDKIELSLRVAELECAAEAARGLTATGVAFMV
jgi:hypothetical protein